MEILSKRQKKGRLQNYTSDLLSKPKIKTYVEKCCRYAWKLVCQTPPYMIEGQYNLQKEVFDKAIHQVSRVNASTEHSSGYIHLVVWPGLFEGSSGRVIRKTEVLLKNPWQTLCVYNTNCRNSVDKRKILYPLNFVMQTGLRNQR